MLKRKRDPTFSTGEKNTLVELVEKYFHIVENKKTDNASVKTKNNQWQTIAVEFNAISNLYPRDWTVLKICWENLKKRAKQINTARNQHFLGTGGGPPKKFFDDPVAEKVLELIQTRVTGFVNSYDSDGTHILAAGSYAAETAVDEQEDVLTCNFPIDLPSTSTASTDWSQYTPGMLREPINPVLTTSRSPSPGPSGVQREDFVDTNVLSAGTPLNILPRLATIPDASANVVNRRRRPVLRRQQSLNDERIKALLQQNSFAEEEHKKQLELIDHKINREVELLKRDKIETEKSQIELAILKKHLEKMNQ